MTSQHFGGEFTLQRGKTNAIVNIALEKKLIQTIAKSTNAVVENDWISQVSCISRVVGAPLRGRPSSPHQTVVFSNIDRGSTRLALRRFCIEVVIGPRGAPAE